MAAATNSVPNHTCECHKIKWDFTTGNFAHTLKDTNVLITCENSPSCQTKVNHGIMTMDEYFIICKVNEECDAMMSDYYNSQENNNT